MEEKQRWVEVGYTWREVRVSIEYNGEWGGFARRYSRYIVESQIEKYVYYICFRDCMKLGAISYGVTL